MNRTFTNDDYLTLGKLVDAVLHPKFKLDESIEKIEREIKVMNDLKDAGHIAQTADMMDIVSGTGLRQLPSCFPRYTERYTSNS